MNYNQLNNVIEAFREHDRYLILIHDKPDGDALGSGTALALFLAKLGKRSAVLSPSAIPERLAFVKSPDVMYFEQNVPEEYAYEAVITADVASTSLLCGLEAVLSRGVDIVIDHHRVNTVDAPVKYVDENAAATGEIIFSLCSMYAMVMHNNVFDTALCSALYTAISSDTGCFRYGNTTAETLDIASKLMSVGIPAEEINRRLFDTKTLAQIRTEQLAYQKLALYHDNRLALIVIDCKELEEIGASEEDTDTLSQLARMIVGVQIGVLMREKCYPDGKIGYKFSVRSNVDTDVSALCAVFNGGGHKKAAGCTIFDTKQAALEAFVNKAADYLA